MASSGKKNKTKWKQMPLADVIDNSLTLPCKPGWAEEVEDYNDRDYSRKMDKVQLPTAPRASRAHEDDSNIPQDPPYMAYLTNLPYDVNDEELINFFQDMKVNVKSVSLPREERSNRFRGYGYVEFDDRASFVSVLTLSDTNIKGRRMRIEVSTNHSDSRGGRMRGNNPEPDYINQDWRSGPPRERNDDEGYRSGRRDYGDRGGGGGYGRRDDRRGGFGDRDRDRGGYRDRGFGNRDREGDSNREWVRDGERWRDDNRDRGSFGGRSGGGSGGGGHDDRRNEYTNWRRDMDHDRDRDPPERSEPKTRPKIALQPRTVPLETDNKETETSSASIFGGAKPVNTAAREREIEERLARQSAAVDEAPKRRGPPSQESWDRDRDRGRGERDKDRGRDRDRSDDKDRYKGGDRDQDRDQEYREKEYDRDDEEDTYSKDRDYDSDERDSSRLSSRDDDDENPTKEKEPAPPPKENPWTRRSQQSASSNVNNGRVSPSSEDAESRPKSRGASPRPPTREESSSNDSVRKYQPPRGQSNDQKRGERKSSGGDDRNKGGSSAGRGGSNSSAGPAKGSTQGSARSRDAKKEDRDEVLRMPKFQEQKAPNFAGSNKYAFLEESSETAAN